MHNGINVTGAWNNYEGLPPDYDLKISDVLDKAGGYYTKIHSHDSPHGRGHGDLALPKVKDGARKLLNKRDEAGGDFTEEISGKEDWNYGGHSENVRLNSWTMYTPFPYNVKESGGWYDECCDCSGNGTVSSGNASVHSADWNTVNKTINWIKKKAAANRAKEDSGNADQITPWFAYQGMNIVHPPYATNEMWYNKINVDEITVPEWTGLDDPSLHPCDLQSSMLKGCTPSDDEAIGFYDHYRRRNIRRIYYAMIAEFDAMVGAYIDAVDEAGETENTYFIVTSDHGDMNMEHQQFYKMVAYDASSRVPMIISGPGITKGGWVSEPTQLIDIFPTILDMAGVPNSEWPTVLDGVSLAPHLGIPSVSPKERPEYVVSQFHGCNIAMSWFMVTDGKMKLVQYGTGKEVSAQLFNLTNDPGEKLNLIFHHKYARLIKEMDAYLRGVVDYPAIAMNVAQYNIDMFTWWKNTTKDWQQTINASHLRWSKSYNQDSIASLQAVETWSQQPAQVRACRTNLSWPSQQ